MGYCITDGVKMKEDTRDNSKKPSALCADGF